MKHVIDVKHLVKQYNNSKERAVDDISFTVNEGEFFSLLGPNGAGKTTTISILTTTLSTTSGEVKIAGYDIDTQSTQIRQNIGVIFQKPSLDQNLTAEENIRLHAVLYGLYPFSPMYSMMPDSYKERVHELAELLDISKDLFKPIKTYSGGMKRKLEIVRSLMHNPKILFLDEPTTGLDPLSRRNLWEYLVDVRKREHTTIFLTTHYLEESENADQIAIINHGKIVMKGTPTEVKAHLVKGYVSIDVKPKDRSAVKAELTKMKVSFVEEEHIRIPVKDGEGARIVQSIKTPLTHLKVHTPSLEDAYLEIVEDTHAERT
ncbi:MAG: hypothetical protein RI947_1246 [Candidatus Parcubacteria bacterium]|jgi:ABC-2 type transport system ATP-binding protein